jgi:uncharacterized membrane protein YhaH (DUF805 family)
MKFHQAVISCFAKYFTIKGRASRSEFWWWTLFVTVGSWLYSTIASFFLPDFTSIDPTRLTAADLPSLAGTLAIIFLFNLVVFVPSWTVTIRRLHDTGRTGAWMLMPYVLIGLMIWAVVSLAGGQDAGQGSVLIAGIAVLVLSLISLVFSIVFFVWLLKAGTRGDNFFGPDPRAGGGHGHGARLNEGERQSSIPQVPNMRREDEVHALYRRRVLGLND